MGCIVAGIVWFFISAFIGFALAGKNSDSGVIITWIIFFGAPIIYGIYQFATKESKTDKTNIQSSGTIKDQSDTSRYGKVNKSIFPPPKQFDMENSITKIEPINVVPKYETTQVNENTIINDTELVSISESITIEEDKVRDDMQSYKDYYISLFDNMSTLNEIIDVYKNFTPQDELLNSKRLFCIRRYLYDKGYLDSGLSIDKLGQMIVSNGIEIDNRTKYVENEAISTYLEFDSTQHKIEINKLISVLKQYMDKLIKDTSNATTAIFNDTDTNFTNHAINELTIMETIDDKIIDEQTPKYVNQKITVKNEAAFEIDTEVVSKIKSDELTVFEIQDIEDIEDTEDTDSIIYASSPIRPKKELETKAKTPYEKFKEMREINAPNNRGSYYEGVKRQFYKQAKFMQDFEDNYTHFEPFDDTYSPTYISMDDKQLRTYFTWRTKTRNGIVEKIDLGYVNVYISEIINKIGIKNSQDGLDSLVPIWEFSKGQDSYFDRNFFDFLKSYYVCNDYKSSYEELLSRFMIKPDFDEKEIEELKQQDYNNKLDFFNKISSYKILSSKFFQSDQGFMINQCIPYVFSAIDQYFKSNNYDFVEIMCSKAIHEREWTPFDRFVYCDFSKKSDRTIAIGNLEVYCLNNNKWTVQTARYEGLRWNQLVGFILKSMESLIRKKTNFKYKFKAVAPPSFGDYYFEESVSRQLYMQGFYDEKFVKVIEDSVQLYFLENIQEISLKTNGIELEKSSPAPVVFDVSKFDEIRAVSEELAERLVVEMDDITEKQADPIKAEEAIIYSKEPIDEWMKLKSVLTEYELEAIEIVLKHVNVNERLSELSNICHEMIEVIFEGINTKAFDIVGDNIIDTTDETPFVYEDYLEFIKNTIERS